MNRDAQDIYSRPGHLVRRLQQIAVAIFMEETAEFDVTPVQYSALLAVRNHPGIDQTSLMKIIAFDRSTIGDVVKRLENKRLIRRATSDADRRTKIPVQIGSDFHKRAPHQRDTRRGSGSFRNLAVLQ
jgi:MarR family transcriptional regulator, lower aerobic nicotinate degradation pathway regulator